MQRPVPITIPYDTASLSSEKPFYIENGGGEVKDFTMTASGLRPKLARMWNRREDPSMESIACTFDVAAYGGRAAYTRQGIPAVTMLSLESRGRDANNGRLFFDLTLAAPGMQTETIEHVNYARQNLHFDIPNPRVAVTCVLEREMGPYGSYEDSAMLFGREIDCSY
ncbi:hypothetical protein P7C73_g4831, partial [Tremellales sp. Uapishka_1]